MVESDNFVVLACDALIADAGSNHQALARNDREDISVEIRKHVDGEFLSYKLILNDGIRNVVEEQAELRLIVDGEDVHTATAEARFHINRITEFAEINIAREPGKRRADAVSFAEQIRFVLVITDEAGLLVRHGDGDSGLRESVENAAEDR